VCEDYTAIECPVYAVGGWTDGYTDAVLRLLEGLSVPCKGLIGPWGHNDPVRGVPGPAIGILEEQVRWWDRWLKGIDNGIMDEPMLTVWLQGWVQPAARLEQRAGRWAAAEPWPSPRAETWELALGAGTLEPQPAGSPPRGPDEIRPLQMGPSAPTPDEIRCMQITGLQVCGIDSGAWCADGHSDDLPADQRAEDGRSLCFDFEPLDADLEILGQPEAVLELAADRPQALVCARLCDVSPDGASLLVTRGILNLTHRAGHEHPEPVEPGRRYTLRVPLDSIGHRFRAGHRLRLAVSPTYWPWAWPSPEPVTLSLFTSGAGRLVLPTRPPRAEDRAIAFPEPEEPPPYPTKTLREDTGRRVVSTDLATGRTDLRFDWDMGGRVLLEPTGTELEFTSTATYSIVEGDPLSARVDVDNGVALSRGEEWDTRARAQGTMTSTATHFHVTSELEAFERGTRVFVKSWTFAIPREDG
jgi:putative CocE/NonD family hydrolase